MNVMVRRGVMAVWAVAPLVKVDARVVVMVRGLLDVLDFVFEVAALVAPLAKAGAGRD